MSTSFAKVVTLALALAVTPGAVAALPSTAAAATGEEPRIESFAVRGSGIERVRVTLTMAAPVERVRSVIFDYGRYPEFMPRYEKAAVLQISPDGGRLVRMQLGGVVRLWMQVQISPPRSDGPTERYEGRLVAGNIKAFSPRWELTSLPGGATRVVVDSFLDPDLALVPSALINSGTRDGMRESMLALRNRIEGRAVR